ncbi:MAG: hypothetical protein GX154_11545 [Clostridiales bacterium]|nr:hypothetical protein [Clostridiales bacterium]
MKKPFILFIIIIILDSCTHIEKSNSEYSTVNIELKNVNDDFICIVDSFLKANQIDSFDVLITLFSNIVDIYFWINYVSPKFTIENMPLSKFNFKGKTIYINSSLDEIFNRHRKDLPWGVRGWYVEMKLDTDGFEERYIGRSYNTVHIDTTGTSIYNPCLNKR